MKDQHQQADVPLDRGTRLAFERTFLAHERTQMAWIRTSLTLISFGFAIGKFVRYFQEQRSERPPLVNAASVGTLMIAIGLLTLVLAGIQHGRAMKALRAECPGLPVSLGWVMVTLLALLGILGLVVLWVRE